MTVFRILPCALRMACLVLAAVLGTACASFPKPGGELVDGSTGAPLDLNRFLARVAPPMILVIGETHGSEAHHATELRIVEALAARGLRVSIGLEAFDQSQQAALDDFLAGRFTESAFLAKIKWKGIPLRHYAAPARAAIASGGRVLALNASRTLSGRVATVGTAGLTEAERSQLPPAFEVGGSAYKERFLKLMNRHPETETGEALSAMRGERLFEAQSLWDDTMAWRATDSMSRNPGDVLVILVGDFHVAYGGGLPNRLRARGRTPVLTLSQIAIENLDQPVRDAIQPHPVWGPRADAIWISKD